MVTKPGFIGKRKRVFGGSALGSSGWSSYWKTKQRARQAPSPNKDKIASQWSSLLSGSVRPTNRVERTPRGDPWPILVASKQIYASHYFTSSLGLAAFFESPGGSTGCRAYLMYLNRSRADLLGWGVLSALKRAIVKRRVRSGLEKNLQLTRQRLESDYRLAAGSAMVGLKEKQ